MQFFNAIKEAEAYDGPSLIIAYSPCINHGLKAGMGLSQKEEKLAVDCGYWHYKMFPESADELLSKTEEFAKVRLNTYKRLAGK